MANLYVITTNVNKEKDVYDRVVFRKEQTDPNLLSSINSICFIEQHKGYLYFEANRALEVINLSRNIIGIKDCNVRSMPLQQLNSIFNSIKKIKINHNSKDSDLWKIMPLDKCRDVIESRLESENVIDVKISLHDNRDLNIALLTVFKKESTLLGKIYETTIVKSESEDDVEDISDEYGDAESEETVEDESDEDVDAESEDTGEDESNEEVDAESEDAEDSESDDDETIQEELGEDNDEDNSDNSEDEIETEFEEEIKNLKHELDEWKLKFDEKNRRVFEMEQRISNLENENRLISQQYHTLIKSAQNTEKAFSELKSALKILKTHID